MSKGKNLRVINGKQKYAFSTGELVESLQNAGVSTDTAIYLARQLEKQYRNDAKKKVKLSELMARLQGMLVKFVDDEVIKRFESQLPPFIPLMIEHEAAEAPFSKRTLAKSLEKSGFRFKEAYAAASQIEQRARAEGRETLLPRDLVRIVALYLEERFGRDARLKYEAQTSQATDLMVSEADGSSFPYSRGILARSVMSVGVGPEFAYSIAKRLEDRLWERGVQHISRPELRELVTELILEEAGEDFARRYQLLRRIKQLEQPLIILIGGAPGVGKSALAAELGYRLGIPRIVASDSVRQALRSLISENLSPALHSSSFTAWRSELLPSERSAAKPKRKRVIRGFQMQVQQLGTALTAIIERNIIEATSLVMEGIHLVPGIVPDTSFEGASLVELVFVVKDEARHRNHFATREMATRSRRGQKAYLEHFKEIRILQDFIRLRAEDEGVIVIDSGDLDQAVERAIEYIFDTVVSDLASVPLEPATVSV